MSTDGSSGRGTEQLYLVIVRYFDVEVNRALSVLLDIATTKELIDTTKELSLRQKTSFPKEQSAGQNIIDKGTIYWKKTSLTKEQSTGKKHPSASGKFIQKIRFHGKMSPDLQQIMQLS